LVWKTVIATSLRPQPEQGWAEVLVYLGGRPGPLSVLAVIIAGGIPAGTKIHAGRKGEYSCTKARFSSQEDVWLFIIFKTNLQKNEKNLV
jgi:hypothetical protein